VRLGDLPVLQIRRWRDAEFGGVRSARWGAVLEICVNEWYRRMVGENNKLVRGWERGQQKLKASQTYSFADLAAPEPERESNLGANLKMCLNEYVWIGNIKKEQH
jgi:hypothetical protein